MNRENSDKVKKVLGWAFGIILGLSGFSLLFSELVPALVLLIMSAALIPPVLKWIEEKLSFKLSRILKVIVLVIGVLVVGLTIKPPKPSVTTPSPTTQVEIKPPAAHVDDIIQYGSLVIGKQCQDECFGTLMEIIDAGGDLASWDLKACQVACQTQIEIDAEKAGQQPSNQEKPSASIAEYEIKNTEDISIKALGNQNLSSYSKSLPTNKKMSYDVLVGADIKEDQVKPTIEAIISDLTTKDPEIDEIILLLYGDAELIGQGYDVARAIWAPKGELGNVNADIAQSNNRSTYSMTIDIKENLEEYLLSRSIKEDKFGLSTDQRKTFFKEYVAVERQAMNDADQMYPVDVSQSNWEEVQAKNSDTYFELMEQYKAEAANKYGLSESQVDEIKIEAFENNWSMY